MAVTSAMRRIARCARLPVALSGPGQIAELTRPRLMPLFDAADADGLLEEVLAALRSALGAPPGAAPLLVAQARVTRAGSAAAAARGEPWRPTRPARSRQMTRVAAGGAEAVSGSLRPLSTAARVGAVTPVERPVERQSLRTRAPAREISSAVTPQANGASATTPVVAAAAAAAALGGVALPGATPRPATAGTATGAVREGVPVTAAGGAIAGQVETADAVATPGTAPAADPEPMASRTGGLAELVARWNEASPVTEALAPGPALADVAAPRQAPVAAPRQAPVAGSDVAAPARTIPASGAEAEILTARESFRGALEEILLAEAHASGIEVRP